MKRKPYVQVLGYVDAFGAIHHKGIRLGDPANHLHYWPATHKTWRFFLSDWCLENSSLSKGNLTRAEEDDVIAFIRKHYNPPAWVLEGEEWEAIGRPRSGKAYEKWRKKWDAKRNFPPQ